MTDPLFADFPDQAGPDISFEAQFRRVFQATGCATQTALAGWLGITPSSVSYAKRRRAIPEQWLARFLKKSNISPTWILYGSGPCLLEPDPRPGWAGLIVAEAVQRGPLADHGTEELLVELVRRALLRLR